MLYLRQRISVVCWMVLEEKPAGARPGRMQHSGGESDDSETVASSNASRSDRKLYIPRCFVYVI